MIVFLRNTFIVMVLVILTFMVFKVGVFGLAPSDKSDAPCTGQETIGRCADKCPNQTDTLLGFDPVTKAAICKPAPTGCPYGDSIPLGAECDKHKPENTTSQNTPDTELPQFVDNSVDSGDNFTGK